MLKNVSAKNGATQQTVTTAYGTDGSISGAGFLHGGQEKLFGYTYLQGSHLLQTLTKPNDMTLTQTYEQHRDLLTQMDYKRGNTLVPRRAYQYDTLGRPTSRTLARQGATRNDVFTYNDRSELISDVVDGTGLNGWDYDLAAAPPLQAALAWQAAASSSGVASRPILSTKDDNSVSVACTYDYMGRRATKKVTENGTVTLHQRYLYRGYLQIAACDLLRPAHPCIWLITWDPTQDVATRPLAIQKDGTWYTYGWDLTKNICEVYGQQGYIRTACTYSPYGQVASSGDVEQPIQWSSEFNDTELALIYYNYRHYNPVDGRWMGRDFDQERKDLNDYLFAKNSPSYFTDVKGLWVIPVIIFIAGAVVGAYAGIFIENECHVVGEIAEKEVRQKCTRTCKYPSMWACCKNTEKSRVRKAKYICELTLTGKKLKFYKWLDNKKTKSC